MGTIQLGPFKCVGAGCGAVTGEYEGTILIEQQTLGQWLDCDVIGTATVSNIEANRNGIVNFPEACEGNGGTPVSYNLAGCSEETVSGRQMVLWPAGYTNRSDCWIGFLFLETAGNIVGINCIPQAGFDTTGPGSEGVDKNTYWEDLGITNAHTQIYNP